MLCVKPLNHRTHKFNALLAGHGRGEMCSVHSRLQCGNCNSHKPLKEICSRREKGIELRGGGLTSYSSLLKTESRHRVGFPFFFSFPSSLLNEFTSLLLTSFKGIKCENNIINHFCLKHV